MKKAIESYLPHSGEMVLIDEVLEVTSDFVVTKMLVKNHRIFCENTLDSAPCKAESSIDSTQRLAFPTHKSIELMAQSLGIFRHIHESTSREKKQNKLGFLLGARRFAIKSPFINNEAIIKAKLQMQDSSGVSIWECEVYEDNALVAKATLSVLNPSDEFIAQMQD